MHESQWSGEKVTAIIYVGRSVVVELLLIGKERFVVHAKDQHESKLKFQAIHCWKTARAAIATFHLLLRINTQLRSKYDDWLVGKQENYLEEPGIMTNNNASKTWLNFCRKKPSERGAQTRKHIVKGRPEKRSVKRESHRHLAQKNTMSFANELEEDVAKFWFEECGRCPELLKRKRDRAM